MIKIKKYIPSALKFVIWQNYLRLKHGRENQIGKKSVLSKDLICGINCIIGDNAIIGQNVKLDNFVKIGKNGTGSVEWDSQIRLPWEEPKVLSRKVLCRESPDKRLEPVL